MPKSRIGAEQARTILPELLERAHHGETTVITRRGKPYAAVVSVHAATTTKARLSLLALEGTGRGLWGRRPSATVKRLRDEWS